jgi:hypothetical protein
MLNENGSHPGGRSSGFAVKQASVSWDSGFMSGRLTAIVTNPSCGPPFQLTIVVR